MHAQTETTAAAAPSPSKGGIADQRLRSFIERIERLEEEKAEYAAAIREVYDEAKQTGFDPKVMRIIVRLRKMETHQREELDQLTDLYRRAVGIARD
jgi:uncharacterized protein (UPF0335 family)